MDLFKFFTIFIVICFASCGIVELDSGEKDDLGVWVDPDSGGQRPGSGVLPSVTENRYMTTMEYPPDYDWISDLQKGSVKCSLVVYVNDLPKIKIAVGDSYMVSSEVDMHRLIGGDLYSDFSTENETVIKKNGRELFRFSGRESIKGMQAVGEDIYTIGQLRSGKGFSYRRNGEEIIARNNGQVFEHFEYGPDSGICFAFSETFDSQSGSISKYYIVRDGIVTQIALRDDIVSILDIAFLEGKPYYIATVKDTEDLLLVEGDKLTLLDVPQNASVLSARMFMSEHSVYIEAVAGQDSEYSSILWRNGIHIMQFDKGMTVSSFSEAGGSVCCVLNSSVRNKGGLILLNGDVYELPQGYVSAGNHTSAFVNGSLYSGLSSVDGGKPGLWNRGKITELKFNGYITSMHSFAAVP